jgi:hypothetical protein
MTFSEVVEVVGDVGKAVYSFGLLAIGAIAIRAIPGAREAAKSLTTALLRHAEALTRSATSEDKIDQIASDVAEIKKARVVDPALLERICRALEQHEAERSGARAKAVR